MRCIRLIVTLIALLAPALQPRAAEETSGIELIVRCDDIGFCHGANEAIKRVLNEGVVTCVSVIVTTPWLDEAVRILRKHPEVSVGVHLTLNSEWDEYRWGPVSHPSAVPSLVDAFGKFFPSRSALMSHRPKVEDVETELRAQIDLALRKGLPISYVDYHMGAAMNTLEFQEVVEKLALEYDIGVSRYFGEKDLPSIYRVIPADKADAMVRILKEIKEPGRYMFVVHPGTDTPEMQAMTDRNIIGLADMAEHRQAETDALCDPRLRSTIDDLGITQTGYAGLRARGVGMERSFTARPYAEVVATTGTVMNPYRMFEATRP